MPFLKSHAADAGPGAVFSAYPEIYRHWAEMGEMLINGPSPFSPGERELMQAFVAGLIGCRYAYVAHTACAEARSMDCASRGDRPAASIAGSNSAGDTSPRVGCCQRAKASTPLTRPVAVWICG